MYIKLKILLLNLYYKLHVLQYNAMIYSFNIFSFFTQQHTNIHTLSAPLWRQISRHLCICPHCLVCLLIFHDGYDDNDDHDDHYDYEQGNYEDNDDDDAGDENDAIIIGNIDDHSGDYGD